MIALRADDALTLLSSDARGPLFPHASRVSCAGNPESIKFGHGGRRIGAGRPRKIVAALDPAPDVFRWYAIRTAHGDARKADIAIRLAGITLFAPTIFLPARPAGRRPGGAYRPAKIERIEYLFWRVMFVSLNLTHPNWRDVLELTGPAPGDEPGRHVVECFITGAGSRRPAPISDRAIERVRELLAPNGCLYPSNYVMVEDRRRAGARARFEHVASFAESARLALLLDTLNGAPARDA
jgi:hypothetical protein